MTAELAEEARDCVLHFRALVSEGKLRLGDLQSYAHDWWSVGVPEVYGTWGEFFQMVNSMDGELR